MPDQTAFLEAFKIISNYDFLSTNQLPKEVEIFLNSSNQRLTIETNLTGYEVSLTGRNIANWIKPLHFESNLNSALDALESTETLQKELRNALLTKLLMNYSDQHFTKLLTKDKYLKTFYQIESEIGDAEDLNILRIRLFNKFSDLVEYTKAVKFGAQLLFGISPETLEYENTQNGVHRIRESLRILLQKYKVFQKSDQEVIIPISLKKAKHTDGSRVFQWANLAPELQESDGTGLGTTEQLFHLIDFSPISTLRNQRIRRVGIQIVDRASLEVNTLHTNIYSVSLQRTDDVGNAGLGVQFRPGLMNFNVKANKNSFGIEWNGRDDIVNSSAKCWWTLNVAEKSHLGNSITEIRDIIVYFHMVHNGFNPS